MYLNIWRSFTSSARLLIAGCFEPMKEPTVDEGTLEDGFRMQVQTLDNLALQPVF